MNIAIRAALDALQLAKLARKWQGFCHRLAGHSAIGYCPVCRRAIYTTFSEHWIESGGH
jgi:hypothetical protein